MKARVFVTLKPGVLDPQGKAIHHALEGLGFGGVNDVRAGKLIELDLADGTSDADIENMCTQLLANTVIENFRIERPSTGSGGGGVDERRGHRLPRIQLRPRPGGGDRSGHRPSPDDGVAPRDRAARRHRADRGPRRLLLRRLPPLRRDGRTLTDHARRWSSGRQGRAGARHLQRLPGADRGRAAAGRVDAQCGAALRVHAGRP